MVDAIANVKLDAVAQRLASAGDEQSPVGVEVGHGLRIGLQGAKLLGDPRPALLGDAAALLRHAEHVELVSRGDVPLGETHPAAAAQPAPAVEADECRD